MNTKKFNLNWQSVLLGMALCAVLFVFIGSKPADAQVGAQQRYQQQRAANMNDIWDKTNALDEKLIAMDVRLNRMEQKIDYLTDALNQTLKIVRVMDREVTKKK